jgi:hypothetical protein
MALSEAAPRFGPCSVCRPPMADTGSSPPRKNVASSDPSTISDERLAQQSETPTGQTATGIPTYTGPRGGVYHYSKSGKKVYERKKR